MRHFGPSGGDIAGSRERTTIAASSVYRERQAQPRDSFAEQLARAGVPEEEIYRILKWRQQSIEALQELAVEAQGKAGTEWVADSPAYRRWLRLRQANPNSDLINDQGMQDFARNQIAASWERGQTFDAFNQFRNEELQKQIDRYNQGPPDDLRGWMRRNWFDSRNNFFRHLQDRRERDKFDLDSRYNREIYQGATRWLEENVEEGAEPGLDDYRQAYEAGRRTRTECLNAAPTAVTGGRKGEKPDSRPNGTRPTGSSYS